MWQFSFCFASNISLPIKATLCIFNTWWLQTKESHRSFLLSRMGIQVPNIAEGCAMTGKQESPRLSQCLTANENSHQNRYTRTRLAQMLQYQKNLRTRFSWRAWQWIRIFNSQGNERGPANQCLSSIRDWLIEPWNLPPYCPIFATSFAFDNSVASELSNYIGTAISSFHHYKASWLICQISPQLITFLKTSNVVSGCPE